ncbi:hypothetical protein DITRI_Ditri06bG0015500 [Diplodiscus trichospermus]
MEGVKKAAIKAGAFGWVGPTVVAVIDDEERGKEIGQRMVEAFLEEGKLRSVAMVKRLDRVGAGCDGHTMSRVMVWSILYRVMVG